MKISFSTSGSDLSAQVNPRFGRAENFLIFDTTTKETNLITNTSLDAAQGAGIKAAETIIKENVSVLITGECGPKALNILKAKNIKVFSAKNMDIQTALDSYNNGDLKEIVAS